MRSCRFYQAGTWTFSGDYRTLITSVYVVYITPGWGPILRLIWGVSDVEEKVAVVPSSEGGDHPVVTPVPTPASLAVDGEVDIDLFAKLKLRTALIESVEAVPKSKKLYKLHLDVGDLGKRQIVSGIAQHYTPEELIGRTIVIVANLKPAKLMGVESQGMLLAASTEGDGVLGLLAPDKPIAAGARVR